MNVVLYSTAIGPSLDYMAQTGAVPYDIDQKLMPYMEKFSNFVIGDWTNKNQLCLQLAMLRYLKISAYNDLKFDKSIDDIHLEYEVETNRHDVELKYNRDGEREPIENEFDMTGYSFRFISRNISVEQQLYLRKYYNPGKEAIGMLDNELLYVFQLEPDDRTSLKCSGKNRIFELCTEMPETHTSVLVPRSFPI